MNAILENVPASGNCEQQGCRGGFPEGDRPAWPAGFLSGGEMEGIADNVRCELADVQNLPGVLAITAEPKLRWTYLAGCGWYGHEDGWKLTASFADGRRAGAEGHTLAAAAAKLRMEVAALAKGAAA